MLQVAQKIKRKFGMEKLGWLEERGWLEESVYKKIVRLQENWLATFANCLAPCGKVRFS